MRRVSTDPISTTVALKDLRENERSRVNKIMKYDPLQQKRNRTLRVSNSSNPESRITVKLTAPLNSRSIRANSSVTHWRSSPMFFTKVFVGRLMLRTRVKRSLIADKCGEVVRLSVESAAGTQSRRPPIQQTAMYTSWMFGELEKSKDLLKASVSSTSRGQC